MSPNPILKSQLKPLTLYGSPTWGNSLKVAMILHELSLPYTAIPIPFDRIKSPDYVANINPNGRIPALVDPNNTTITDSDHDVVDDDHKGKPAAGSDRPFVIWESGAIISYLVSRYDGEPSYAISFPPGGNNHHLAQQFLHFQTSGQGPYYGQLIWFLNFHEEEVPSAVERYVNEVRRVTGVLEECLGRQPELLPRGDPSSSALPGPKKEKWLVGGKMSYADLAFVVWQVRAVEELRKLGRWTEGEFSEVERWLGSMVARESYRRCVKWTEEANAKGGE
ncbi:hypothetical protein QBC42DRAFT_259429 [Cladorrhinum samala]|uniref:Glutathione S-transferase n=1 Tax=Cladorrhinum samala TaxID=585594 RepID=A0AAV9HZZ0_9PEZI|nr:hypothetical protein QBC42DRAFT_259429 [Cladorrhinum samala]